jgi:5-methylcytosine-specific restriction endonuclease McrA
MEKENLNIFIRANICFLCGKEITPGNRIRAHLIPKRLHPKHNVFIFLHKECEQEINNIYVNQQTKTEAEKVKKKALNILSDFKLKIKIMEDRINEES